MRIVPRKKIQFDLPLTTEQLIQRIRSITTKRKVFSFQYRSDDHHLFTGEVSETGFKIQRIIRYRNSFLPVIVGSVRSAENGSKLEVLLRLHRFVLGFMIVWFSGTIPAFVISIVLLISSIAVGPFEPMLLIGLFLAPFGIALVNIPFWIEARIAEEKLQEVLV